MCGGCTRRGLETAAIRTVFQMCAIELGLKGFAVAQWHIVQSRKSKCVR
ncbi:hypothetical protein METH_00120 [Leisingera methylohalidivorans DSM 14336]|uniref:Uncharacterized protein n=1 Tax=Leisingera methylohalidivorans DSM 14336 TaxID=999552 RepID=V9W0X6_9RHOB|nr:hypothetical protein METH_00120 [Leisingera methylohalidivorans DSM 14336]